MQSAHSIPVFLLMLLCSSARTEAAEPVFEKDILPIFEQRCARCHGDKVRKADLDVRSKAALLKGGEAGAALAPGAPERSLLWLKVAADKMPPGKEKLTEAEKATLREWIDRGAKDDGKTPTPQPAEATSITEADRSFWAFRPPTRPAVPEIANRKSQIANPLDAFLLAELTKKGLSFNPEAERLALLRRFTFDLTGLPPTPAEIAVFRADDSPNAYEKVVERLLASPRYGERWGRHWLDLAGYADSEGILDADYVRSAAWRYRDYVVRSLNADKPYDRFLQEQLAGDELSGYWTAYKTQPTLDSHVVECLEATGFLRCASDTSRPDFVNIKNAPGYYFQTLDDTLRIVASATLGLTLHCAKCHSHKYDPIPQTDYYRMQAIFMGAYRPAQWVPQVQRRLLEATAVEEQRAKEHNAKVDAVIAGLKKQVADLQKAFAEKLFAARLAALPAPIRDDVKQALAIEPAKRTEVQKYLASKFEAELKPPAQALPAQLAAYPEFKGKNDELQAAIKVEEAKRHILPEIRAAYDLPGEPKTHLLRRGDYLNPGPEVQPGVLSVLDTKRPFAWTPPEKDTPTSGRRLAFAQWLTQPDHPLTARVLVNRVWLHHFGEGLVSTPDNFGRTGTPPSHPALLDWLAVEFADNGWSLKHLHRLIVTSAAYRQSTAIQPGASRVDPDNRLLWRQRLRRLEAEALRDAVLAASGTLYPRMFGQPVAMVRRGDGEVVAPDGPEGTRRSVYLQVRRSQPLTLLQVFDQPVMETNCTRRGTSTVAGQALNLLNSDFLVRQAELFADRVLRENPNDPAATALLLAFGRPATPKEQATLQTFLKAQAERYADKTSAQKRALTDLCHMLLGANEFAYVD